MKKILFTLLAMAVMVIPAHAENFVDTDDMTSSNLIPDPSEQRYQTYAQFKAQLNTELGFFVTGDELDPVWTASDAFGISTADIAGWDALVTNATHTGDVTGATALTIAAGAIDIAMHSATGTPSATTYYRGDNTWGTPAGGSSTITDLDGTAWRVFYTNGSGDVTELALGASGSYLGSNGASAAPTWSTPSGAAHDAVTLGTANGLSLATQELSLAAATSSTSGAATAAQITALEANTAKTTNATHTGDATGSGALTLASVAISGKTLVTALGADYILLGDTSDAGSLKRALISDITSGYMPTSTYDAAGVNEQLVGLTATQTLTNKTLSSTGLELGTSHNNLRYNGSTYLNDTDTTVNHVLSANKVLALDALKANIASPTFTGTVGGITATMVGLGNVDNSDATNGDNIASGTVADARVASTIARDSELATIIDGTSALGVAEIASGACATAVTTTATGAVTTDSIEWSFNADPTAVTGYSPSTDGMLTIIVYPTADNVNFKVCNNLAAAVTPGAITLNWRIVQ